MKVSPQSKLIFHGVDIVDIELKAFRPHEHGQHIKFDVTPHVFYPQGEPDHFRIVVDAQLQSEGFFSLGIKAVGYFEFDPETEQEQRKDYINRNSVAIVFPYLRAFIATLSANLGNTVGNILLPTQFFSGELPELAAMDKQQLALPFTSDTAVEE